MLPTVQSVKTHYLATTTLMALFIMTMLVIVLVIVPVIETTDCEENCFTLSHGIKIGLVGIITFFGMLIISSFFEEHRHDHSNPKKSLQELISEKKTRDGDNWDTTTANFSADELKKIINSTKDNSEKSLLHDTVAGRGIMRKAMASSLIITYILVLGVYIDNGDAGKLFEGIEVPKKEPIENPSSTEVNSEKLDKNLVNSDSNNLEFLVYDTLKISNPGMIVGDGEEVDPNGEEVDPNGEEIDPNGEEVDQNNELEETKQELEETKEKLTKAESDLQESKEAQEKISKELEDAKEKAKILPKSLIEHFTIVITAVVSFYFGNDILKTWLKNRSALSTKNTKPGTNISQQSLDAESKIINKKLESVQIVLTQASELVNTTKTKLDEALDTKNTAEVNLENANTVGDKRGIEQAKSALKEAQQNYESVEQEYLNATERVKHANVELIKLQVSADIIKDMIEKSGS